MASIGLEQAQVIYKWPRLNLDDDVKYVLSGRLAEVPQKRSKVVRIFLSSTFTGVLLLLYECTNVFKIGEKVNDHNLYP